MSETENQTPGLFYSGLADKKDGKPLFVRCNIPSRAASQPLDRAEVDVLSSSEECLPR